MIKCEEITKNLKKVSLNDFELWFSYETLVAYKSVNGQVVCSKNQWTKTTAVHLNEIEPNKDKRIDGEKFNELIRRLNLEFI